MAHVIGLPKSDLFPLDLGLLFIYTWFFYKKRPVTDIAGSGVYIAKSVVNDAFK